VKPQATGTTDTFTALPPAIAAPADSFSAFVSYVPSELSSGWTDSTLVDNPTSKPVAAPPPSAPLKLVGVPTTAQASTESTEVAAPLPPPPKLEELSDLLESDVDLGDLNDAVFVSAVPEPVRSEATRRRLDADPDPVVDSPSSALRQLVDSQIPASFTLPAAAPTPVAAPVPIVPAIAMPLTPPIVVRTRNGDVTPSGELIARSHARDLAGAPAASEPRSRRRWIATVASTVGALAIAAAILAVRAGDNTPASAPVVDVPAATSIEPAAMVTVHPDNAVPPKPVVAVKPAAKPPIAPVKPAPVSPAKPVGVAKPLGIAKPAPSRPPMAAAPAHPTAKPAAKPGKSTMLWDPNGLFAPKPRSK
jgi:hypothetical protein